MPNKKSVARALVGILIAVAGALVIFFVWNILREDISVAAADSLCRGNIALREKATAEIKVPLPLVPDPKIGTIAAPIMLCDTTHLELPLNKDDGEKEVKKQFAELMASCWSRYGEGRIKDPIKQGDPLKINCETCYSIRLKKTSKFETTIKPEHFKDYLFATPYKVTSNDDNCRVNGGYCIDVGTKDDCVNKFNDPLLGLKVEDIDINTDSDVCSKKGKKACCYTDYQCLNRGGVCSAANPDVSNYRQYNEWDCPRDKGGKDQYCFVKNENYYSYEEYIQRFGGTGNIVMLTDDDMGIKPGETYAISFGSPNIGCGLICKLSGVLGGTSAVVVVALVVVAIAPPIGIPTIIAVIAVTAGATIAGKDIAEKATQQVITEYTTPEKVFQRDINTIYLTTRNYIDTNNLCSID